MVLDGVIECCFLAGRSDCAEGYLVCGHGGLT